ncbi:MAG: endonuclease domain-containing protein [Candidatus Kerfeldbacteria bacterium]|nr:endonuclease domain-containing protein [Candidatus Kerfeldbacteria bacterium]
MTVQEVRLWVRLQRRGLAGYKFRRQQPIGPYIVDFYCVKLQLAIELDGGHHFGPEQRQYDTVRDQFLRSQYILVIRYPNSDVDEDIDAVLEDLLRRVRRRALRLPRPVE